MARPLHERFQVASRTLRCDRLMTQVIRVGGIGVVLAVLGICLFLVAETLPLFRGAVVQKHAVMPAKGVDLERRPLVGLDDWAQRPFVYEGGNTLRFFDVTGSQPPFTLEFELPNGAEITAWRYDPSRQRLLLGTQDGRVGTINIVYQAAVDSKGQRTVFVELEKEKFFPIGRPGAPVLDLAFGGAEQNQLWAVVQEYEGKKEVHVTLLQQKRRLLGSGRVEVVASQELTPWLKTPPSHLLVPSTGDAVLAATERGEVEYFFREGDKLELRQRFTPFQEGQLASMNFILGDVSLVFTNESGQVAFYSLLAPAGGGQRRFHEIKTFPLLAKGASFFAASGRNKSFLIVAGEEASVFYATTASLRWHQNLGFTPLAAQVDRKFEHLLFLDAQHQLHLYAIGDPHPEAGIDAFFRKVWYEGAAQPDYVWQSTGGSDEFEPKLSLVPLIFGTFKGTLWALVMAVPVALLAAIYTSQFMPPEQQRWIKPVMELMASLPSVVLGFLAALWLAPILETRVPSVLLLVTGIPLIAVLMGWLWSQLPVRWRHWLPPSKEWLAFMPLLAVSALGLWKLGPALEVAVFEGDFRQWWPRVTGTSFDQRNSMVVGIMMGFAVIPIIFTIAEDALSSVPPSLRAAALALGASRWQVVRTVVLPVASAGIFSALIVGVGRAVGETMIVVMATGNTPVMEWNLFNGMRTLSANIAVELPEAPVRSTHYRTLFLSALVLFALTFVINTLAEVLRQRLRRKFQLM